MVMSKRIQMFMKSEAKTQNKRRKIGFNYKRIYKSKLINIFTSQL